MHGRLEDTSAAFLDLIFKVSLLESVEDLKEAITKCLKNNVADINRSRIRASITTFTTVLQDIVSSFAQDKSSRDDMLEEIKHDEGLICSQEESGVVESVVAVSPAQPVRETVDAQFVQITADNDVVKRRISAFIEKQRIRINLTNIQEFCGVEHNADDSCARVDAVFVPRPGSKSHILVRKVVNHCGPQTRDSTAQSTDMGLISRARGRQPDEPTNWGLEERIGNMEAHMCIYSGGPVPKDLYQRVQLLENRVLHLESISPEYFYQFPMMKRKRLSSTRLPVSDSQFIT